MLDDLDQQLSEISNKNIKLTVKDFEKQNDVTVDFLRDTVCTEMEQIKQALSRIDEGTYGICLSCGQTIKQQQMKENIFSWLCVDCTKKGAFSNKVK